MPRFRIAVATAPFRLPLKEAIATAAVIGAQGIQFDLSREVTPKEFGATALRQLIHYVEERNLRISAATFSLARPVYDLEGIDLRVTAIKEALELASRMNSRQMTVRIGRIPDDADSSERSRILEILRDLARHGNRVGVIPCITPTDDAPQTLVEICQMVTDGLLGIDFDPAGTVMARRDPVQGLRDLHAHVHHVEFRDGRRDVDGVGVEVPLGRGQVKWDETLALLDEMRFTQWATVRRTTGEDRVGDCQKAIQYIQRVAAGL